MPLTSLLTRPTNQAELRYDTMNVPGILADTEQDAYFGLGKMHGKHFQYQSTCLWTAAEGKLSERILATPAHLMTDRWVVRLGLFSAAEQQAQRLDPATQGHLEAYLQGFRQGATYQTWSNTWYKPWCWFTRQAANMEPRLAHLIASVGLSGLLSSCKRQGEMKMLTLALLQGGANPSLLSQWFGSTWPQPLTHQDGQASQHWPLPTDMAWPPGLVSSLVPSSPSLGQSLLLAVQACWRSLVPWLLPWGGGASAPDAASNAWAVSQRQGSQSRCWLAGDPHLAIRHLPALLHPVRAKIGEGAYWLGFAMAGLPLLAIGRNNHVAWSCTYAVGDTIHWSWTNASERRLSGQLHSATLQKRWSRQPETFSYWVGPQGQVAWPGHNKPGHDVEQDLWPTCYWPGGQAHMAETLRHFMALNHSQSVQEAQHHLEYCKSRSLSLVLADKQSQIGSLQMGLPLQLGSQPAPLWQAPGAVSSWSALEPIRFVDGVKPLPISSGSRQVVVKANQRGKNVMGQDVTPFGQPFYRKDTIQQALGAMEHPNLLAFAKLQHQLDCPQARAILPMVWCYGQLPVGPWRKALQTWDGHMTAGSQGAQCWRKLLLALYQGYTPLLGGKVWQVALHHSSVSVWFAAHLDRTLMEPGAWASELGDSWRQAIATCCKQPLPHPHGHWFPSYQGLPRWLVFPFHPVFRQALPRTGSIATVNQGNALPPLEPKEVVGAAARMLTDLHQDEVWLAWPGGTDENPYHQEFATMLTSWQQGQYHVVRPPHLQESKIPHRHPVCDKPRALA